MNFSTTKKFQEWKQKKTKNSYTLCERRCRPEPTFPFWKKSRNPFSAIVSFQLALNWWWSFVLIYRWLPDISLVSNKHKNSITTLNPYQYAHPQLLHLNWPFALLLWISDQIARKKKFFMWNSDKWSRNAINFVKWRSLFKSYERRKAKNTLSPATIESTERTTKSVTTSKQCQVIHYAQTQTKEQTNSSLFEYI